MIDAESIQRQINFHENKLSYLRAVLDRELAPDRLQWDKEHGLDEKPLTFSRVENEDLHRK